MIIEQVILPASDVRKAVHRLLHYLRRRFVEAVDAFTPLKIDVRVLGRAANERVVRVQGALAMLVDQLHVNHRAYLIGRQQIYFADLVRSPKSVEEMNKWHARFERRSMGDQGQVLRRLHGRG